MGRKNNATARDTGASGRSDQSKMKTKKPSSKTLRSQALIGVSARDSEGRLKLRCHPGWQGKARHLPA